jgi:hypothetical protein
MAVGQHLDGSPFTSTRSKGQLKDQRAEENLDTQQARIPQDIADTGNYNEENPDSPILPTLSEEESFLQGGCEYLTAPYMMEYLEKHEDLQAVLDAAMLSPVDTFMMTNNVMVKGLASVVTIIHHLAFQGHKLTKDCR